MGLAQSCSAVLSALPRQIKFFCMLRASDILKSPATPAAILLYGVVFGFAIAYNLGVSWERSYTIALYLALMVWTGLVVFDSVRERRPSPNRIDYLFAGFFCAVLVSAMVNWWGGTIRQLQLMPVFFIAPYVLGRTMRAEEVYMLRNLLIGMGILLLPLILVEYLRETLRGDRPFGSSPLPNLLFGQGHGVMLSGLLLSATLLGVISVLLTPSHQEAPGRWAAGKGRYAVYALLISVVVAMGWISSRGPILAGLVATVILVLLAPKSARRRKIEILVVLAFAISIAVIHSRQLKQNANYYANVIQAPLVFEGISDGTSDSIRLAGSQVSILGAEACKRILDSVSDRWIHYNQAVALFLAKPLFGAGANQYGFYACTGPGSFPHSTVLQVFAELGVFVGMAYCALIWSTFHALMWMRRHPNQPTARPVWTWLLTLSAMQLLIAQLNGDYFISAALYFVMGVAANARDCKLADAKGD